LGGFEGVRGLGFRVWGLGFGFGLWGLGSACLRAMFGCRARLDNCSCVMGARRFGGIFLPL
jgi:type IV secretory pathway TrbD component